MKVLEAVRGLCWPTARKMEGGTGRRWAVGSRASRYSISCWSWRKQRVRTGRGRFSLQVSSPLSDSGTNTRVHGIRARRGVEVALWERERVLARAAGKLEGRCVF